MRERGVAVLRPIGRLDSDHAPSLEEALCAVIQRGDRSLLVDMAEVPYISSRGLRVFLVAAKQAAEAGCRLAACSLQEFVRNTFDISGFEKLIDVFDSSAAALEQLPRASDRD